MKDLTQEDILDSLKGKIYTKNYVTQPAIKGVKIVELKNHVSEDGDFYEIISFKHGKNEYFPDFEVTQINRSRMPPHSIKAWHLHFSQDEVWHIPPEIRLLVGLWDIRKASETKDVKMRFVLGGGTPHLIYIPKGIAHGSHNLSGETAGIIYFMNQKFNKAEPDEKRISWDILGTHFWLPQRD